MWGFGYTVGYGLFKHFDPHLRLLVWHGFFCCFILRYLPQNCKLLWQQGSNPHDAQSLSRGPGRFPAGCAAGWMFHEGQFEQAFNSRSFFFLHNLYIKEILPFGFTGSSTWGQVPPVFGKCHGSQSLLSEGSGTRAKQQRGPAGGGWSPDFINIWLIHHAQSLITICMIHCFSLIELDCGTLS